MKLDGTDPRQAGDRRGRMATSAAFFVQGLCFAVVVTRVSVLQSKFHLSNGQLTLVLLIVPVIAGVGSVLSGPLAARLGSGTVLRVAQPLVCLSLPAIGFASTRPELYVTVGLFGLFLGAVDATMNMQGAITEKRYGYSVINVFYGFWSAAGILGGLWNAAAGKLGLSLGVAFTPVAGLAGPSADHTVRRFGATAVVRAGAVVAGLGLLGVVLAPLPLPGHRRVRGDRSRVLRGAADVLLGHLETRSHRVGYRHLPGQRVQLRRLRARCRTGRRDRRRGRRLRGLARRVRGAARADPGHHRAGRRVRAGPDPRDAERGGRRGRRRSHPRLRRSARCSWPSSTASRSSGNGTRACWPSSRAWPGDRLPAARALIR